MKPILNFAGRFCDAGFAVAALLLVSALPAAADDADSLYNNVTGVSQSQLNIVINGNHSASDIPTTANPFGPGGSVSYNYNATQNQTTISFTGPNPVAANGSAYAGLDASGFTDQVAYAYWGTAQSSPPASLGLPAPSWYVSNPGSAPNTGFVILYATIELANGQTAGEWDELQVPSNQPFQIGLGNNDMLDGNMFAFNVGFQFSNTEIPLDDLNLNDYPPSGFTPLPGFPDESEIMPGGSLESPDVPEPSTIALFSVGALGLLGRLRITVAKK